LFAKFSVEDNIKEYLDWGMILKNI